MKRQSENWAIPLAEKTMRLPITPVVPFEAVTLLCTVLQFIKPLKECVPVAKSIVCVAMQALILVF